jgi:hypothetical protein
MIAAIATTTSIGVVSYLWLTVATLPVSRGLRATLAARWGRGWRHALPLAVGVALMAAAIACAAAILIATCAPLVGVYFVDPVTLATGTLAGAMVWCARGALLGVPRLSADVEVALALAVVALRTDDPAVLFTVEREYVRHVLRTLGPEEYATAVSAGVLHV